MAVKTGNLWICDFCVDEDDRPTTEFKEGSDAPSCWETHYNERENKILHMCNACASQMRYSITKEKG